MRRFLAVLVLAATACSQQPSSTVKTCEEIGHAVHKGDSDYRSELDRDGDGVACE